VYVTLGGYERRWIPPGSFGEDVSNVGVGHVFVSYDHGQHFTNISGNLPDIAANWTAIHNGKLLVATDLGVYIQTSSSLARSAVAGGRRGPAYAVLGRGLPAAPVFTLRADPGNPNRFLIATYGRSDWTYTFTKAKPKPKPQGGGGHRKHRLHCAAGQHKVTKRVHGKKKTVCVRRQISRRPKHPHGFTGAARR
jgi:hypothetical protein